MPLSRACKTHVSTLCSIGAPADVLNVVGFVQNEHGILRIYLHCAADDWVQQVVVGAEDELGMLCSRAGKLSISSYPGHILMREAEAASEAASTRMALQSLRCCAVTPA